jgi:hypothetical protein
MRATSIARYGVEYANQTDEVRARTAATNLERYGATNPFSRESSTFDKVQTSLDGKRPVLRGADNPFARDDVKARVRDHWMVTHGVTNPQQVAEIRARTRATNVELYGGELMGSPVLAEKIRATNQDRYGDAFPQRTDVVKDKQRETNLERWGVPWTGMHPEIRTRQLEAHYAKWGSHYFVSDEGKAKIKQAMRLRYGVDHPSHIEGWWDRMVATFRERYGGIRSVLNAAPTRSGDQRRGGQDDPHELDVGVPDLDAVMEGKDQPFLHEVLRRVGAHVPPGSGETIRGLAVEMNGAFLRVHRD